MNRYYRHVPWWRRLTGWVRCPVFGGGRIRTIQKQKVWVCEYCEAVLIHKKGGKKYGT